MENNKLPAYPFITNMSIEHAFANGELGFKLGLGLLDNPLLGHPQYSAELKGAWNNGWQSAKSVLEEANK